MLGSKIVCECLIKEGIDLIFGIPGGRILPLYDVLPQYPNLRHILMRHEQGAAHAADGYARSSGKIGVCVTTSGPGATNLITGIAAAHMDSSPIIAITGQVPLNLIGRDAFQETDVTGIVLPITKYRYLVLRTDDIAGTIKEACAIARNGRPGPVVIDIPQNILLGEAPFKNYDTVKIGLEKRLVAANQEIKTRKSQRQLSIALDLINQSQKPVIIAGRGIIISGAYAQLIQFAEKHQAPVATTLLGISCFPQTHYLSLGMIGIYGNTRANTIINSADLIIAVGMRFDDRATGDVQKFALSAKIVHIDIDPSEIDKNVKVDAALIGDAAKTLEHLTMHSNKQKRDTWISQINNGQKEPIVEIHKNKQLLPQYCIRSIYEVTKGTATIVTGIGQHQMWVARHYVFSLPNTLITAGGLGPMGFGLPAAIGAQFAKPNSTVWLIDGDGSFQMTMHELAVVVQEKLPLKMAIINNRSLGMVRELQQTLYCGRYVDTALLGPNFTKIAQAYGIPALRVTHTKMVKPAIERAMKHKGPFLIDFMVNSEENVLPKIKEPFPYE